MIRWRTFHVREDVAPLKHPGGTGGNILTTTFHVREDVAPLKRITIEAYMGTLILFPRS